MENENVSAMKVWEGYCGRDALEGENCLGASGKTHHGWQGLLPGIIVWC